MGNFRPDSAFEKAILRSDEVRALLQVRTNEMASQARRETKSKRIAAGIVANVGIVDGMLIGRVAATSFISHFHEFGTVKMRARPFLVPAAMALGYTIKAGKRV